MSSCITNCGFGQTIHITFMIACLDLFINDENYATKSEVNENVVDTLEADFKRCRSTFNNDQIHGSPLSIAIGAGITAL